MNDVYLSLPPQPILKEVMQSLELGFKREVGSAEYLEGMRRTVPGVAKLYGVKVPKLREISKKILTTYLSDDSAALEIAKKSWSIGSCEHQLIALFMLAKLKMDPDERWELGVQFLADVNNWESCDQLCHALLGQALALDPGYMDHLESWLQDENFWVRRAALVSPVLLRRANYSPELARDLDTRTLVMSGKLLDDPEKHIHKAVNGTVREVIKRQYDLGFKWLMKQARRRPARIAHTTLKLASKKLTAQDQEAFLHVLE